MAVTQKEMLEYFIPRIEEKGKTYEKKTLVTAKKAKPGEKVITRTSDGVETQNTAKEGDFLVENQTSSGEQYLVGKEIFESKYRIHQSLSKGWASYHPIGKINAIEVNAQDLEHFKSDEELTFTAPWGESMVVKEGDFLVCPLDFSEIYRIAKKEFGETYKAIKA
ncbi:MAG: hypothetical protein NXH89_18575 [Cyclobacteriaceae bacterium]|uniref:hypothetical protein n=1 Tax=Algoriphagus marincola TaxID=264027 RepID=UPI0004258379|nr:hypothetical protein [Algoriphagus marincola]MCR9084442.1 hypothetical protein [Cyclobacteriaceae bacterium]